MPSQEGAGAANGNGSHHASRYPPFPYSGILDKYESVEITPCMGTQFKNLDLAEFLELPNSEDGIKDLALLRSLRLILPQTCTR
jgi:hypothetical protein